MLGDQRRESPQRRNPTPDCRNRNRSTPKAADLAEELQGVYDRIADMRHQIFALEDENRRLTKQNENLQDTKKLESELEFDGEVYWRVVEGKKQGPYCPNCWHDPEHRQLVPLQHQTISSRSFHCTIHNINFGPSYWGIEVAKASKSKFSFDRQF